MELQQFTEQWENKSTDLVTNLTKFYTKGNATAGTRARKNAQELKALLQEVRTSVLVLQKERKIQKATAKAAATTN